MITVKYVDNLAEEGKDWSAIPYMEVSNGSKSEKAWLVGMTNTKAIEDTVLLINQLLERLQNESTD